MRELVKKSNFFDTEIIVLILTFLFYLFRPSIPSFKYPFILLYLSLIIYSIFKFHGRFKESLKKFAVNYYLVFILALILTISFLLSGKIYLIIFKDVLNAIILVSVFFLMSLYIATKDSLDKFASHLYILLIFLALLISLNGLSSLLDLFPGGDVSPIIGIHSDGSVPVDNLDNNFGILPVIFGMIAIIVGLAKAEKVSTIFLYNFLLIILSSSLFLSGSRRGLIILSLFILVLILAQVLRPFKPGKNIEKVGSISVIFLSGIILLGFSVICLTFYTSNSFKNKTLKTLGCKNVLDTKVKITDIVLRYVLNFNKSTSFSHLYNIIWTPVFDSGDPESSWGTRNHKNIFPLTGKNVEIVPSGVRGYLLDSTCNSHNEKTYCDAYSLITNLNVQNGEMYKANVFCFVSEDFDGDLVRLTVGTDCIINGLVYGKPVALYDLNQKGIWKELRIDFKCKAGSIPIFISFIKNNVEDFSKLKGYVIFAFPGFQRMDKGDSILSVNNTSAMALRKLSKTNFAKPVVLRFEKFRKAEILPFESIISSGSLSLIPFQDPVRRLTSKLISEDTTYYGLKHKLSVDTVWNYSGNERIIRWRFALQIFSKEYNWSEKLIGGGFNFLNWYGFFFLKDKKSSDWPHNPFLAVLLYSGIIGLLIYCFFMYKVSFYYLKYSKEYPLLFIFFIITFFFSFFSGSSPFDPPIMGFFVILPFFIHSIHTKDKPESINN
jgi:hypothetical protein